MLITTGLAAKISGMSLSGIAKACDEDRLRCQLMLAKNGHHVRLIDMQDLDQFLDKD